MNGARRRPIVFDGAVLADGPITGVGRALLNGLHAYVQIAEHPLILLLPDGAPNPDIPGLRLEVGFRGFIARALRLPGILRKLDAAALHSPVAALPVRAHCPMIATVHDLPWMAKPRLEADDAGSLRHRLALRHAARRATALISVSRHSRHHLLRFLKARPHARLKVIANGVAAPTTPAVFSELRGPLLILASDRPRKNLAAIREAHGRARELHPSIPGLRVIGAPAAYVSEAEKIAALRTSTALLNLSLFEGFGMPVIEAFQHGVPVLCSDRGALREVANDAAAFADPESIESMTRAIIRICGDDQLRAQLRERGLARGQDFTPARTAADWRSLHGELIS